MAHLRPSPTSKAAGLLTAVTVSLALLAGCNPAPFQPGTGAPTANNPGAASPAPAALPIAGTASLKGVPMANATVKVFNAITNQPATIIAPGAGNVIAPGAGNVIAASGGAYQVLQAGGVTTDAKGNFNLTVAEAAPVLRVVVSSNGQTITALVTNDPAKKYSVAQTFTLNISEVSTVVALLCSPLLTANETLGGGVLGLDGFFGFLRTVNDNLGTSDVIDAHVKGFNAFQSFGDDGRVLPGKATEVRTMLNTVLKDAGAVDKFSSALQAAIVDIASAAKKNGQTTQRLSALLGDVVVAEELSPIQITITLSPDGKLTVGDRVVDLNTVPTNPQGNEPSPKPSEQPSAEPSTQPSPDGNKQDEEEINFTPVVSDGTAFEPSVMLYNHRVVVSQPGNTDDIKYVATRMKKADVITAGTPWEATDFSGSVSASAFSGGLSLSALATGDAPNVSLPSRFNFVTLDSTKALMHANLMRGTAAVATFTVYADTEYYYLVTEYLLSDAITINGGHTTYLNVNNDVTLTTGKSADTVIKSRKGNVVEKAITVQVD